jgi:MazG family protein
VVFHAQIATEAGRFTVNDVIERVAAKMVRRHPHVFGGAKADTPGQVLRSWEAIKQAERAAKAGAKSDASMLDSVGAGLPAVMEAFQMTTKVSRVGFDWPSVPAVMEKLEEELGELREVAGTAATDHRRVAEELGDLLFAAVNVARLIGADPESALKAANRKFRRRFAFIEQTLSRRGRTPAEATLEEMEALWEEAKAGEKPSAP